MATQEKHFSECFVDNVNLLNVCEEEENSISRQFIVYTNLMARSFLFFVLSVALLLEKCHVSEQ